MARKEFIRLMEENIVALDRMATGLQMDPDKVSNVPHQQLRVLVRLYGMPARLKDIARREHMSTPNLCAIFRKLERDGLVARTIDESDRRNTWYRCTPDGDKIAVAALNNFRSAIEKLFSGISPADEQKLTGALKALQEVLKDMEKNND